VRSTSITSRGGEPAPGAPSLGRARQPGSPGRSAGIWGGAKVIMKGFELVVWPGFKECKNRNHMHKCGWWEGAGGQPGGWRLLQHTAPTAPRCPSPQRCLPLPSGSTEPQEQGPFPAPFASLCHPGTPLNHLAKASGVCGSAELWWQRVITRWQSCPLPHPSQGSTKKAEEMGLGVSRRCHFKAVPLPLYGAAAQGFSVVLGGRGATGTRDRSRGCAGHGRYQCKWGCGTI